MQTSVSFAPDVILEVLILDLSDRALCLPTFSHFLIVNTNSLSLLRRGQTQPATHVSANHCTVSAWRYFL
jgi:hypothetical protein